MFVVIAYIGATEVVQSLERLKKTADLLLEPSLESVLSKISHASQQIDKLGQKKENANLDDDKLEKVI